MGQLTQNSSSRLMYLENKDGDIDGHTARIGWVTFSRSGRSIYYRGRELKRIKGGGVAANYYCSDTSHEYWVSGVKRRRSNTHRYEITSVHIDEDAVDAYRSIRD